MLLDLILEFLGRYIVSLFEKLYKMIDAAEAHFITNLCNIAVR